MAQTKSKAIRRAVWDQFISGLGENPVRERPGRIEPRAVKRIYKYEKLNVHRRRYKDRPSRNQRRRHARKKGGALI